jgi:integrase
MKKRTTVKVITKNDRQFYVYRWRDPTTGRWRQETGDVLAKKSLRRIAERKAGELEDEINSLTRNDEIGWFDFVLRYEQEHIATLRKKSRQCWKTVSNHIENILNPEVISDIDSGSINHFRNVLRRRKKAEASIDGYLAYLRAALNWARELEIIEKVPIFARRRRSDKKKKSMRSRPIVGEEFDRLILAVDKIRKNDAEKWKRLLRGLWFSGLRLSEALSLSWSRFDSISVDMERDPPVLRIMAEGEKGRQDRLLPIAAEFASLLAETPIDDRKGRVFGISVTAKWASRQISKIGERARVIVGQGEGSEYRTVTAHDLRRSFGSRWAKVLSPAELKILMRHASIDTTLAFYVDYSVDELSKRMGDVLGDGTEKERQDLDCQ